MIYVDELTPCQPIPEWPYTSFCHLRADTVPELHAFAQMLGLRLSYAQRVGTPLVHYDLTAAKRAEAIQRGAIPLPAREVARILRRRRLPAMDPEETSDA